MSVKNIKTLSQIVALSRLVWFKDMNLARPTGVYGDPKQLIASLTERGWLQDDNGTLKVEDLPKTLIERAMKERGEFWENLKAAAKSDSKNKAVDLTVFEELYVEKGKLIQPDLLGVSGNRRSQALFPAQVERRKAGDPLITEIPVIIRKYTNEQERLDDQINENELKELGFLEMSNLDRLISAKKLVELGSIQADLRKTFKDGMGQKLWGIITLNSRFPNLKIIERMLLDPKDDRYLSMSAVKFSDLPELVMRTDPKALEEKNAKLTIQGKELIKPATEEDINAFFKNPAATDGNEKKVMKGDAIRGLAANFPALPIRAMANAIAANNVDGLKVYQTAATGFNALDSLISAGDYPRAELILAKLVSVRNGEREAMFARILDALDAK